MFTKKVDNPPAAREDYERVRKENEYLRDLNKEVDMEKTRRTRIISRLLEFHGVKENYMDYRNEYPYTIRVSYLNVDRLDADLEAVYAVTKADAARARLTKTEEDSNAE